jgi:hypothetical protein
LLPGRGKDHHGPALLVLAVRRLSVGAPKGELTNLKRVYQFAASIQT